MPALTTGTNKRIKQDNRLANYWRKRSSADGRIDFRMSSRLIYNLVRALTRPYRGAHIAHNETDIKVWRAEELPCEFNNFEPGKILRSTSNGIDVKCGEGAIRLLEHEFTELPKKEDYFV